MKISEAEKTLRKIKAWLVLSGLNLSGLKRILEGDGFKPTCEFKYYQAVKEFPDLFKIGDKFVSWDDERMYPINGTITSSSIDKSIFVKKGLFNYFYYCSPVPAPILIQMKENKKLKLRRLLNELDSKLNEIKDVENQLFMLKDF